MSRIAAALEDFASLEALATRSTALTALDPRAKILATLGFIVAVVSFDRYSVAALLPFAAFPVVLAVLGDIPWRVVARKVWIAAPFAVMVGIFNPLLDHTPMLQLWGTSVSGGWVSFASILTRFALTVAVAVLLLAGTGLHPLCTGLARMGVPGVFTTQLLLMHRYATVLSAEAARMNLARELRGGSARALSLPVYATLLGHLLLRSFERAQRIYQAMASRGFDGAMRPPQALHWRSADLLFVALCWASFGLARTLDLPHLLGRLLLGQLQ